MLSYPVCSHIWNWNGNNNLHESINVYGNLEWNIELVMEPTCSDPVLLGLYDSACPSLHCTPYENKIGGLPVCIVMFYVSSVLVPSRLIKV